MLIIAGITYPQDAKRRNHPTTQMNQEQKTTDREQEIVFTNSTSEDFDGRWNKKIYRLKAGRSYYLPLYLAESFGKHLVDRELNKMAAAEVKRIKDADPRTDQKEIDRREQAILQNTTIRQELMDKCVILKNPAKMDHVTPQIVTLREIPLKTNLRSAELVASGKVSAGDLGTYNKPMEESDDVDEEKSDESTTPAFEDLNKESL